MKYGIYFAYWTKEWSADYKYYIDKVAALGFDILEISAVALTDAYTTREQLEDLRKYAAEKQVTLTAGYGPSERYNLSSGDPGTVREAMAFYKDILTKLQILDIHMLGGGLYSYWPVDYGKPFDKQAELEHSIRNMREVAKIAEDCDVTLGMEVLNRFEGYLLNTCEEAVRYVEAVGSSRVGIMLDTFHMNIEENDMTAAIRLAGDRLCHFHVGEQNRQVPGRGTMPWAGIGQALRDIRYEGAVVMEPFVMPGGTVGSDIKVWRNVVLDVSEAALDRDAKGAVQFLKHVFER